ncbi:RsmB/NOP family class I SAM-dependent RNA methyltransferase [Beijerinckia indica]|uniref:Fmu (Sun) domain protein n=1 Tax=Beijerinckia indica subsp. indica (strain ATCC 9039 / DSM 1715 / NCIMB 8712) TaxID=395963 RepID=B2IEE7_BEII9|nr:RsmB/NOP family class I SAM-dependent RNA methyltransferase [Beijerinckia indica]ACB95545.1 Fmu (Sun) domain protein [Beijerinckia indica subsp. indica ATCC 9039]
MIPAARLSAAIEILADIETRRRPAADAVKDWGLAHRFAGSKDRAAIAGLVYDALRRKASSAWIMGEDTPRAVLLGSLRQVQGLPLDAVEALFSGEGHAPALLSDAEKQRYRDGTLDDAPASVAGDFPQWLEPAFQRVFGALAAAEGEALAARAPLDLRVNLLKGDRAKAIKALAHLKPEPTPYSPFGLRLPLLPDGRAAPLVAEAAYVKGLVEVQDEGSQLAALLAHAKPGEQVLDLCAGGGGKTLALAALMNNKGQIYASDNDGRRLAPIHERLKRADVRNVQVRAPRGRVAKLDDLEGRCDLVFVDAPCTGTGTWRRNPDAKWRIRPGALEERIKQQNETLATAARYVKPGGRIVYATCSVLAEENEDRITDFLKENAGFQARPAGDMAREAGLPMLADFASTLGPGLRLTPRTSGTDGFYVVELTRE